MHGAKRMLSLCTALLFVLCGCQNVKWKIQRTPPPQHFSAHLEITSGTHSYGADCLLEHAQSCKMTFTAPQAVSSLELIQTPTTCDVRFLGLEVKAPALFLPQTAFAKQFFFVCAALSNPDCYTCEQGETAIYYIGKTPAGEAFTVTADKKGNFQSLTMKKQKLTVLFSDFQAL